ncbi:MAG TPA: hypothetical protein DCL31_02950, partial [Clostridium sp.]|nr:hypothetical protein [Clostridium sp.]
MLPYDKEIDTKNTNEPKCTGIATSEDKRIIILSFDKRMDASTLEKASNYYLEIHEEGKDSYRYGLPSSTEVNAIE